MIITDQNGRKLSELLEKADEQTERLDVIASETLEASKILKKVSEQIEQSNLIGSNSVLLLEEIKEGHEGKFFVWLKKHKWTTVFSVFFGFAGLAVSLLQVVLVLTGLYYYPQETRALIQTVLIMLGVQ